MSLSSHWRLLILLLLLAGPLMATTVILNSQDYRDILSTAVYARSNDYNFVFALTPNQSVFIARYYSTAKNDPIIYIEGARSVLPNMAALLREAGLANLTVVQPANSVQEWIADQMPRTEAIVVGGQYGQDALAVTSFAALRGEPLFFIDDPSAAQSALSGIAARGYSSVLVYGPIAHQIPPASLAVLANARVIDTGNRYANNVQIAGEFLNNTHTSQVLFVSGKTFEKSMVDKQFPIILVGRSDVSSDVSAFIARAGIRSGVVYSGDADIVDGVSRLRALHPGLSLFVKFGEGYLGSAGSAQPLPLVIVPLPSPVIALEVLNLTYNVPAKSFELRVTNHGGFAALVGGVSVPTIGSAESSQILLEPNATTTLMVPLDATAAVSGARIAQASLTMRYGEDTNLLDNIDTITFSDVPTSYYNDTSTVRLTGITYSDADQAFIIHLDGLGWAEGTLSFAINNQPTTVRFAPAAVNGPTSIRVKYLLTSNEQRFVNGLPANYFLRTGSQSDILLKETRGQSTLQSENSALGPGLFGLPLVPLCLAVVLVIIVFALYQRFAAPPQSGGFD